MDRIELTIFRNLVNNKEYLQKAYPFLKAEYFHSSSDRAVFEHISKYVSLYNTTPTTESLTISLQGDVQLPEKTYAEAIDIVNELHPIEGTQMEWLIHESEAFCKTKAIYNAISRGIKIIDGSDDELRPDSLPTLLSDALSVCFDTNVGHDFFDSAESRYEFYHTQEERIPFDIDYFNKITDDGLPKKTLTCLLAGTNAGKSLIMCHMAAGFLSSGYNVLYITMEMSEMVTSLRIDANLLDTEISEVKKMAKNKFMSKIDKLKEKSNGRLVVKEYPTSGAHVGHFKGLLNELKLKKKFKPDIIFIDYLNICLSSRVKGANANSYTIVKSIAEELRGLAVEQNVPIVTATQTTRNGVGSSDLSMTDVSESIGLAATVDMLLGVIRTPELDEQNQLLFKLLKSRFVDAASFGTFLLGVDRSKMKLYDLERSAQDDLSPPPSSKKPIGKTAQPEIPDNKFSGSSFKATKSASFDSSDFKF